jgi:hypothetical protein
MEWELVKPWVNRVGILLEFLSFWLAAPEILGEERLRALERRIEQATGVLLWALLLVATGVLLIGALGLAAGMVIMRFRTELWDRLLVYRRAVGMTVWWGALGASLGLALEIVVTRTVLRMMADDARIRQRSLAVGAVLFVVGFLLQLIATF